MGAPWAKLERFICPRCQRTHATDKPHIECEYCAEAMMPMVTWVRRQSKKSSSGNPLTQPKSEGEDK